MSRENVELNQFSVFDGVAEDVLEKLENRAWNVDGETDDPIYYADDTANLVYFINTGRVRLFYPTSKDRNITLDFLEHGDLFGELALVDFETRGEAAETLESSLLTVIPGDYFRRVMEDSPDLFESVFDFINHRRWRIQNRLKTLAYEDARKKIVYVLLDLGGLGIEDIRPEPATLEITHTELADMSGLARPTTTKILNQLKDEGLIGMGNSKVELKDPVTMKEEITILT